MKILIGQEDDFPVYSMDRNIDNRWFEKIVEVPEDIVIEWENVIEEYEKVQLEMRTFYNGDK